MRVRMKIFKKSPEVLRVKLNRKNVKKRKQRRK